MNFASRGYRVLPSSAARAELWSVGLDGGQSYDNGTVAIDWTYHQGIHASVSLFIELKTLRERLGIAPDSTIGAMLAWRTARVGLRGSSTPVTVQVAETDVSTFIPAGEVGGTLTLEARLILLDPGRKARDPLAPSEPGAILWSDQLSMALEGIAPRLPILSIPAGHAPFYNLHNARWHVKVEYADLDAPIDAAVRVYLNEANEKVLRMMLEPDGETASVMSSSLLLDVQREFVRIALLADGQPFDPDQTYADGSLGAAMAASIGLFAEDFDELQNRATWDAARLDIEVQGRLGQERAHG